nr:MAG TPA: hypothetical protein [Caudoviricetes sp.]
MVSHTYRGYGVPPTPRGSSPGWGRGESIQRCLAAAKSSAASRAVLRL